MIRIVLTTASMIVLIGGLVIGSAATGFTQGPDGGSLLLACCLACSGSQGYGKGHQEMNQQGMSEHGAGEHEATHPRAIQGQAPGTPAAGGNLTRAKVASKDQELCPILGAKVDRSVFTDYEGARAYFCCPACISRFKEDPAKYIQQMQGQGITMERAPGK